MRRRLFALMASAPKFVRQESNHTPREDAICAHADRGAGCVRRRGSASQDARFAADPMVLGEQPPSGLRGRSARRAQRASLGRFVCARPRATPNSAPIKFESLRILGRQVIDPGDARKEFAGV